jgi:hypothetical protein
MSVSHLSESEKMAEGDREREKGDRQTYRETKRDIERGRESDRDTDTVNYPSL